MISALFWRNVHINDTLEIMLLIVEWENTAMGIETATGNGLFPLLLLLLFLFPILFRVRLRFLFGTPNLLPLFGGLFMPFLRCIFMFFLCFMLWQH